MESCTSPAQSNKRKACDEEHNDLHPHGEASASIEQISPGTQTHQGPDSPNSGSCIVPPSLPNGLSRQPSPAASTISTLTTSMSASPPPSLLQAMASGAPTNIESSGPTPAKRRKLTTEERAQREQEKAEKARLREAQKAKREEEKLSKDEERRVRNEAKEEKRRAKDLELQRKEEEKQKKERAQSRINNFFAKPATPSKSVGPSTTATGGKGQSMTAGSVEVIEEIDNAEESLQQATSDYSRTFLPFALPSHSICAPVQPLKLDADSLLSLENELDQDLKSDLKSVQEPIKRLQNGLKLRNPAPGATPSPLSMKQVMILLTEPEPQIPEMTDLPPPSALMKQVPVKYIYFDQDVRPPYIGTWTKITSKNEIRRARKNPFLRVRPDTDYDYDSEAEWEEVEDGEDLVSEGESEPGSVDGSEDMGEFLDDEGSTNGIKTKSRLIATDLEPICTGICWEDGFSRKLRDFKLELVQPHLRFPIDPFSDMYWTDIGLAPPEDTKRTSHELDNTRVPLEERAATSLNSSSKMTHSGPCSSAKIESVAKPPARLLTGEELEAFKREVEGSDLNKSGLLGVLKKKFPKTTNATLKDTLGSVAARVGKSEAEKRWTIIQSSTTSLHN